jgi:hypothetical protein
MKDDQVGDGFGRNAQLSQLIQEGEGDPAHAPFHDGVCFPFNEVEVEVGAPEKIDSWCNLLRKRHRSKITNQGSRIQGSEGFKDLRVPGFKGPRVQVRLKFFKPFST